MTEIEVPKTQIHALTGIRIIPALLVVIYHSGRGQFPFTVSPVSEVLAGAASSVSFFFFLSGFILTHVYAEPFTGGAFDFRAYLVARLARIYPVYLLGLLLQALFVLSGIYADRLTLLFHLVDIQPHLLLLQSWISGQVLAWNLPGWSLSVELFLYLSLPLLLHILQNRSLRFYAVLTVGLYALIHGFIEPLRYLIWGGYMDSNPQVHDFLLYYPLFHWPTFILGSLAYYLAKALARPGGVTPWLLSGTLASALLLLAGLMFFAASSPLLLFLLHNGFLAPLYAIIVGCIYLGEPIARRTLGAPMVVLLGEASYSVYILQLPVLYWLGMVLNPWHLGPGVNLMIYVGTLVLLSVAIFLFFERPSRAWLRKKLIR